MILKISYVHNIISKLPQREKLKDVIFVIEDKVLALDQNGNYIKGSYQGNLITLYSELIKDKEDLRKVILHEIAHHLGMGHKSIEELGL